MSTYAELPQHVERKVLPSQCVVPTALELRLTVTDFIFGFAVAGRHTVSVKHHLAVCCASPARTRDCHEVTVVERSSLCVTYLYVCHVKDFAAVEKVAYSTAVTREVDTSFPCPVLSLDWCAADAQLHTLVVNVAGVD